MVLSSHPGLAVDLHSSYPTSLAGLVSTMHACAARAGQAGGRPADANQADPSGAGPSGTAGGPAPRAPSPVVAVQSFLKSLEEDQARTVVAFLLRTAGKPALSKERAPDQLLYWIDEVLPSLMANSRARMYDAFLGT